MVEGGGFEPPKAEPSDLQSDPFSHSGTPPKNASCVLCLTVKTLSTINLKSKASSNYVRSNTYLKINESVRVQSKYLSPDDDWTDILC